MPISEGTSAEMDTVIVGLGEVAKDMRAKKQVLTGIRNLDGDVKERLSTQGNSAKTKRNIEIQEEEPGRSVLDVTGHEVDLALERVAVKEMEIGERQREMKKKKEQGKQ